MTCWWGGGAAREVGSLVAGVVRDMIAQAAVSVNFDTSVMESAKKLSSARETRRVRLFCHWPSATAVYCPRDPTLPLSFRGELSSLSHRPSPCRALLVWAPCCWFFLSEVCTRE